MRPVKTHKLILLAVAGIFLCYTGMAQAQMRSPGKYFVEHFGEEEGLPQNSINSILPDANDFLWIATESGISRFNGNRFLPVPVSPNLVNSNFARIKHFLFKGKDTILAFSAASHKLATIVNNRIVSIEELDFYKDGILFLNLQRPVPFPLISRDSGSSLMKDWNIHTGGYFGTGFNKDSFLVTLFGGIGVYDSKGLVRKIMIKNLDPARMVYVDSQAIYIDEENYINYYSPTGLQKRELLLLPGRSPLQLFHNSSGNSFFCVKDTVLYRVEVNAGRIFVKKLLSNLQNGWDISNVYEKDSNTIVTGTGRNGLYVYKKQFFDLTDPVPKGEPEAFYLQQLLNDGRTILAGNDKLFINDRYAGKTKKQYQTHNYSALTDNRGNYWYVYLNQLLRSREIGIAPDTMLIFKGHPGILFQDGQQRVWFSSGEQFGYFKDDQFTELKINGLNPTLISCLQQEASGRLLIGTREGLYVLTSIDQPQLKEITGLRSQDVRFILPDPGDQFWVCTYGNGLFLVREGVITKFPESTGRLDYLHSIIEDAKGYFWMPTNNGLFVTSRRSLEAYAKDKNKTPFYYRFSTKYGFRTNEFNGGSQPAYLRLPGGDISLASMKGLVRFNPAFVNFGFSSSPILVDNIHADSMEIMQQDNFDIENSVSNISFTLSNSFWGEKDNDRLEYQLSESDKTMANKPWLPVDGSGNINLFSPGYGNYQLVVRKRMGLDEDDYIYKTINFRVLPKWYQTQAFLLAAVIALFLLLAAVFFWRRGYYRRSNRLLQQKVEAATLELQQMNATLEKKVEERTITIQKEKELSQSIINNLPGVFYIFDQEGTHLLWNRNFETVIGYNSEEIRNMKAGSMIAESEMVSNAIQKVFVEGYADIEATVITKAGKTVPHYFNGISIIYEDKPCVMGVGIDISQRVLAEKDKDHANYLLNERIKELTTLYRAGLVLQREEKSILITLQDFVSILPAGWQYPDITAARITLGEMEFTTPGFKPGPFSQHATFSTNDGNTGKIEVVYLEERPPEDEGPFLAEERKLIDMLADMLRVYFTRKEAIAALQKSEANLHTIFDTTDTIYVLLDVKFQLIAFNQRAFDFSENELKKPFTLYTSFIGYFPEDRRKDIAETMNGVMKGSHISYEVSYPQPGGKQHWYYVRMFPITNAEKIVFGMMAAVSDITEKKLLEQEILDQKVQEQKSTIRAILTGEERERNKIGQELHDNVNQILAGTKLYLGMARKNKTGGESIINESIELIDSAIEEIRALSKGKVTPLKKVNLREMLQSLVDHLRETSDIKINLVYKDAEKPIEDDLKLNIYRIIQEQLNNIGKHAGAKNIAVEVEAGAERIRVLVTDDGKGFEPKLKKNGIGISNMTNRVESFNGTMVIDSSPGKGCRIEINIPY